MPAASSALGLPSPAPRACRLGALGGRAIAAAVLAVWAGLCPTVARGQFDPFDLPPGFFGGAEAEDDPTFDPKRLHGEGLRGLHRFLDLLLPDTAAPALLTVPEETVHELVARLGDDSYRVRELATAQLAEIGEGARPILLKAAKHANAEISWRATRVLRGWEGRKYEEKPQHLGNFSRYCNGVRDEARLKELARRTTAALDHGLWGDSRTEVLRHCVMTLLRADKDDYVDLFRPYLKHNDLSIALLVTEAAGQLNAYSSQERPPSPLFLAAIRSPREEVASTAINYVANGYHAGKRNELKEALLAIFDGKNENLRFQAAFPLMRLYKHTPAYDYLLQQAGSGDVGRRHNALSWLQAESHLKNPPDEKLLKALKPLLKDDDFGTRMMAALTLSSYKGEEVVRLLIPLLRDKEQHLAGQVAGRILEQPDKKMLRRVLGEVTDEAQKKKAKELLKQLDELDAANARESS